MFWMLTSKLKSFVFFVKYFLWFISLSHSFFFPNFYSDLAIILEEWLLRGVCSSYFFKIQLLFEAIYNLGEILVMLVVFSFFYLSLFLVTIIYCPSQGIFILIKCFEFFFLSVCNSFNFSVFLCLLMKKWFWILTIFPHLNLSNHFLRGVELTCGSKACCLCCCLSWLCTVTIFPLSIYSCIDCGLCTFCPYTRFNLHGGIDCWR